MQRCNGIAINIAQQNCLHKHILYNISRFDYKFRKVNCLVVWFRHIQLYGLY